jgi:D-alanine--D-alanine ligase
VEGKDIVPGTFHELLTDRPDVAFNALHGGFGEDGTIQSFLDVHGIPYTGSDLGASAISGDKYLFKQFVISLGYNAPKGILIQDINELEHISLSFPLVIKPLKQGCSYGVFLVHNYDELVEKLPFSFQFGDLLLLEEYIEGREFTIGVINNPRHRYFCRFIQKNLCC